MGTLCSTRVLRLYSDSEAIITEGWGGRCYNPESQVVQELYDQASVSVGKKNRLRIKGQKEGPGVAVDGFQAGEGPDHICTLERLLCEMMQHLGFASK